jgi:hypothetical protein
VSVTACSKDAEQSAGSACFIGHHLKHRHIERAAAKVVHHDGLGLCTATQSVGKRSGRWFWHEPSRFQPCETRRITRRLSLAIVEVRRNGDDSAPHRVTECSLSPSAQFRENHCPYLLRQHRRPAGAESGEAARARHDLE